MSQFAAAAKNPPWVRGGVAGAAGLGQPPPPGTSALNASILAAQAQHAPASGGAAVPVGPLATAAVVAAAQTQQAQQAPAVSAAYGTGLAAITLTQSALQQGAVLQQQGIAIPASLAATTQVNQGIAIPASLAATTQVANVNSGVVVELARLPQPGVALPTSLATTQVATVSYPAPRLLAQTAQFQSPQPHQHQTTVVQQPPTQQHAPTQQQPQTVKQRFFTGSVTKLHENFGFVDDDVFFQLSAVKGTMPKTGERVLVEASYNPNMPFKWNATRVQVLPNQMNVQPSSNARSAITAQPCPAAAVMASPVSVGLSVAPGVNMNASLANITNNQPQFTNMTATGRWQVQQEIPSIDPMASQRIGLQYDRIDGRIDGSHQWVQEIEYGDLIETKTSRIQSIQRRHNSPPTRRERERERESRREERRERYRERERYSPPAPRKRSRSPRRTSRSPPRRRPRIIPRYTVQIPKISLDMKEGNVMELRKRYTHLYIPSDFCAANFLWQEAFPPNRPFSMDHQCSFHIMNKDIEPLLEKDLILEPSDADHIYSAKVMLMATPSLKEIFQKSCALAEDVTEARENFVHPARLISFLVGLKGKSETVAIGGPWSPSLDGPNPDKDPGVLIRTAIRTCKALTGIDLSKCSQWYRFAEIYYRRGESTHKGRAVPTRVETVVLFLPDVWSCLPTRVEWDGLVLNYKKQLQEELDNDDETQDDDECMQEEEKKEPTHYSELDPKTIKVNDLKRELEIRNLSTKGLKSQLIARLTKALKSESEKEEMGDQQPDVDSINDTDKQDSDETPDDDKKKKEDDDRKHKEEKEKNLIVKRIHLPELPAIVVHPSRTAKGGKFDCTIMSLSLLLDYRQEDNKEHSFEVSLFAEIFNEMLMRDFGFRIYRSVFEAPETKDDEKDIGKEKKKFDKKDEKRDRKDDKEDYRRKDDCENESDEDDTDDYEEDGDDKKEKEKKRKKKRRPQMYTHDPHLLLSYVYFDQTHCGYLLDKDLEEMLFTLGLHLSRAQVRKLVQKVCKREMFRYRKLTDRPMGECDKNKSSESSKPSIEELAAGNKRYLPVFKTSSKDSVSQKGRSDKETTENGSDKDTSLIPYQGALVDIGKLLFQLERSEKARVDSDEKLKRLEEQLESMNNLASKKEKHSQKLSIDLDDQKHKLNVLEDELKKSVSMKNKYQQALVSCREQLCSVMSSMDTALKCKCDNSLIQKFADVQDVGKDDVEMKNGTSNEDKNEDVGRRDLPTVFPQSRIHSFNLRGKCNSVLKREVNEDMHMLSCLEKDVEISVGNSSEESNEIVDQGMSTRSDEN